MRSRQAGLTLVELMVVVAVMAVIAAIAYPLYTSQTQKARRADAKVALETVALAQERHYTINGSYAATLGSLQVSADIASGNSNEGYYSVAISQGSNQDFTVTATPKSTGAQASDATSCASFTINHQGTKTATGTAANCW